MKVCGIISEYNPFHNGHAYHIKKTKEETNAEAIVAVISGNFIQRGLPALFDKWTRAKIAIQNGIDLVIELPAYYSISSAEYFAQGAVSLIDSLGIVSNISFGNKCSDINILRRIANVLYLEPEDFKNMLHSELKKGISYPIARSHSLKSFLKKEYEEKLISEILLDSNNILGIEYLKAIINNNSTITPVSIERTGTSYNSTTVINNICSATAIREMYKTNALEKLPDVLPKSSYEILNNEILNGKSPMFISNFEKEILYAIRMKTVEQLSSISDVTEGLENIIKKASMKSMDLESLIEVIKSKRYTRTRIQRILMHILLDITKNDIENYKYNPQYIRVLGFNKTGEILLSQISKTSNLPIVTSVNKFLKNANEVQRKMIEKDILSSNIYTLGYQIPIYKKTNLDFTMPVQNI